MPDSIHIQGLRAPVRLGVPDEERARWQTVEIDITLTPRVGFHQLKDDIQGTIDYERVSLALREMAALEPRRLLETLAEDLARHVMAHFPVRTVTLTIRKFILPGTQWVGVTLSRQA